MLISFSLFGHGGGGDDDGDDGGDDFDADLSFAILRHYYLFPREFLFVFEW